MKLTAATLLALLAASAVHAEPALTIRATELQAQAQADAATIATLPEKTRVTILRRSGAWSEVKTEAAQTGWVRMFSLRLEGSGAPTESGNSLKALSNLLSSGRTTNTGTVTTGVRGLSAEDLKNARANPAEFKKMQKFAVDKRSAQAYAQRTQLVPVKLDYLVAPAAPNSAPQEIPGAAFGISGG